MKIVSLLPAATEILFALGAGDDVVGVTFECDHPPEARSRQIVSTSAIPEGLSPQEIDAFVAAAAARGDDLYHLRADALAALDADVVVTQDLCAVCAIDVAVVEDAMRYLGCRADVVTFDPHTIDEVFTSVVRLGERVGRRAAGEALVADLRARLDTLAAAVADRPRPRVLLLEWTDPPYAPGHWIPEMVQRAGGIATLGVTGGKSTRITWDRARNSRPDLVVCAPCGYDLAGSTALAGEVAAQLPDVPVWAVDANASFARSGPRIVDGVQALAAIFHPGSSDPRPDLARRVSTRRWDK